MSLIVSWIGLPLMMGAVGLGWGVIVERLSGKRVHDALVIPLGLAAALVVAGTFTTFSWSAPGGVPAVGAGGVIGLVLLAWPKLLGGTRTGPVEGEPAHSRWRMPGLWAAVGAVGALLAFGAPVLLSGAATFTGYVKLDDTATWFGMVDIVMSHSHSLKAMHEAFSPPSTFTQVFEGDVGEHYPLGAFMLLGIGNGLTGIDPAWIIQPDFACCAAGLALAIYALAEPLISSKPLRALIAFIGAQSALLYGYSLWGGIKEITAAFILGLGVALVAPLLRRPPTRVGDARTMLPVAVAAGALLQIYQVGAGGWAGPVLVLLVVAWLLAPAGRRHLGAVAAAMGGLVLMTSACIVPVWASLNAFLSGHNYEGLFAANQTHAEQYGNLLAPIKGVQLAGIWPAGDFRFTAPAPVTGILIGVVIAAAVVGVLLAAGRRQFGPAVFLTAVLCACGVEYLLGVTPWVLGKSLAVSSPALLTAGLLGAALLLGAGLASVRGKDAVAEVKDAIRLPRVLGAPSAAVGALALVAIVGGVLWSNVLAYSDATLAPRDRLVELQHIGKLVNGKGPTFINEYEVYADRHFLREGAPVGPAEYRPVTLPLRNGTTLTKAAWANIDSFPLSTLLPYRSIVTRRDPAESRPPSIWKLVWQGTYYQLWQRPAPAPNTIIEHIPYGEEIAHPYCGAAESGTVEEVCALDPVATTPSCPQLLGFANKAAHEDAHLLAYQRAVPVWIFGDQTQWPGTWVHQSESHAIQPITPGTAVAHVLVPTTQTYELFMDGSFGRGLEVSVDGHHVGTISNQLTGFMGFDPLTKVHLTAGEHTMTFTYPEAGLGPGSGETVGVSEEDAAVGRFTALASVMLQPLEYPRSELISATPGEAKNLCGRSLEWVEIVANNAPAS